MGVVHKLLERMGFVRLRDYGLILTADRRVVTTRTVLDDGFGSQIVGWPNGDLAVIELAAAPPEPPPRVPPPRPPALAAALAPPVPQAAIPVAVESPDTDRTESGELTEDEWEWEIAVARARAAEATPIRRLTPEPAPVRVNRIATPAANIPEHPFTQGRPRTILPVPTLPVSSAADVQRGFDSAVRSVPQPRRFPKATSRRVA
ncbi:MAG TPA: hypothetical protein VIU61_06940 [Kofleriaceae bacterium]